MFPVDEAGLSPRDGGTEGRGSVRPSGDHGGDRRPLPGGGYLRTVPRLNTWGAPGPACFLLSPASHLHSLLVPDTVGCLLGISNLPELVPKSSAPPTTPPPQLSGRQSKLVPEQQAPIWGVLLDPVSLSHTLSPSLSAGPTGSPVKTDPGSHGTPTLVQAHGLLGQDCCSSSSLMPFLCLVPLRCLSSTKGVDSQTLSLLRTQPHSDPPTSSLPRPWHTLLLLPQGLCTCYSHFLECSSLALSCG